MSQSMVRRYLMPSVPMPSVPPVRFVSVTVTWYRFGDTALGAYAWVTRSRSVPPLWIVTAEVAVDAVLLKVEQAGGIACHTGRESCFFRKLENGRWVTIDPVLKDPSLIYRK